MSQSDTVFSRRLQHRPDFENYGKSPFLNLPIPQKRVGEGVVTLKRTRLQETLAEFLQYLPGTGSSGQKYDRLDRVAYKAG